MKKTILKSKLALRKEMIRALVGGELERVLAGADETSAATSKQGAGCPARVTAQPDPAN